MIKPVNDLRCGGITQLPPSGRTRSRACSGRCFRHQPLRNGTQVWRAANPRYGRSSRVSRPSRRRHIIGQSLVDILSDSEDVTALFEVCIKFLELSTELLDLANKTLKGSEDRRDSGIGSTWLSGRCSNVVRAASMVGMRSSHASALIFQCHCILAVRVIGAIIEAKFSNRGYLMPQWASKKPGFKTSVSAGCQCCKSLRETEIRADVIYKEISKQRE